MGLLEAVKRALGRAAPGDSRAPGEPREKEDGVNEELRVPEVTPHELMAELQSNGSAPPMLLDIREPFERAQALIPNSVHIPMNSIPSRLAELDPAQDIVVYCAHGSRSYGVTAWLVQQGYRARSLRGGIVDWQHKHGPIERGYAGRS